MPNKKRSGRHERVAVRKPPAVSTPSHTIAGAAGNGSSDSNTAILRKLYSSLLRCRRVQEWIRDSTSRKFEIGIGREAVAVGSTAELDSADTVAASPGNLPALIVRGTPLEHLNLKSQAAAACPRCSTLAQPADPFNFGTGIAVAQKFEQKQRVVIAFAPQPKPALETWHDALKFAAVHKLPIVFVIENGIAAEPSNRNDTPHLEACSFFTRDYGFPGIVVDGNDVVAVWRVAHEAIQRARIGSGPTLIDCRTDESRDPLVHMEHYLRVRGAWDAAWHRQMETEITAAIAQLAASGGGEPLIPTLSKKRDR